ncbi:hypothetical protein BXT86_00285 [candidate division WOR-3 bacterium 4484_100]|uniref:Gingipain domain-containing protein n=1 Tax=candidate division WOR-3 bacterium 4484_100 TaxID=1936077 RepID=A0A1V4QGW7_UNCW3|nr:MAG: hypothetical protein BXT86_00285 [candidate division WOR-3 bacterium 4484_100]
MIERVFSNQKIVLFLILLFVLVAPVFCQVTYSINLTPADLSFSIRHDYDVVALPNCTYITKVSEPMLPMLCVTFVIPTNVTVTGFTIEEKDSVQIDGNYQIFPSQPIWRSDGSPRPNFVPPDTSIYNSLLPYPGKIVELSRVGYFAGIKLAKVFVFPIQYIPGERKLILFTHFRVNLQFEPASDQSLPVVRRTQQQHNRYINLAKKMVVNPNQVDLFANQPPIVPDSMFPQSSSGNPLPKGPGTLIIITADSLVDAFGPLAEWYRQRGIRTDFKTIESINEEFGTDDLQTKIRKFIRNAYINRGTEYILLGGDTDVIPERLAYPNADYFPDWHVAADAYYACLDGTWNANNNEYYGEYQYDKVDLEPEVWVGRVSVLNSNEVSLFVNKVLIYERTPPDYTTSGDLLLLGAAIGDNCSGGEWIEDYVINFVPGDVPKFRSYDGYYSGPPDYPPKNQLIGHNPVINDLNEGFYVCYHEGHGNNYSISVKPYWDGSDEITNWDLEDISNGERYGLFYSMGCETCNFDGGIRCFGETWLFAPHCGVAYIGNSRDGVFIYSEEYAKWFFKLLYKVKSAYLDYSIGKIYAQSKMLATIDPPQWEHFMEYTLNLMATPAMPVWTQEPASLSASHLNTIPVQTPVEVTITVTSDGMPVENAYVCLYKPYENYYTGYTDDSGKITFLVYYRTTGEVKVTCTRYNEYTPSRTIINIVNNPRNNGPCAGNNISAIPKVYALSSIYPNPSRSITNIEYQVPVSGRVRLKIYDINGRLVKTLIDEFEKPGYYNIYWNRKNETGTAVGSGIYFCIFEANNYNEIKKLIILH